MVNFSGYVGSPSSNIYQMRYISSLRDVTCYLSHSEYHHQARHHQHTAIHPLGCRSDLSSLTECKLQYCHLPRNEQSNLMFDLAMLHFRMINLKKLFNTVVEQVSVISSSALPDRSAWVGHIGPLVNTQNTWPCLRCSSCAWDSQLLRILQHVSNCIVVMYIIE